MCTSTILLSMYCILQRETLVNLFDFYFCTTLFWTTKSMYLMYVCLVSFFYLRFFFFSLCSWRTSEVAVSFNVLCYTLALSYTTYTRYEYMWCIIYFCGVYIHCLHSFCISGLFFFEENAVNCVLYATKRLKRQFQNKSLLGRICKLQVSRLKYFFNLLCIMSSKGKFLLLDFFLKYFYSNEIFFWEIILKFDEKFCVNFVRILWFAVMIKLSGDFWNLR